MDHDMSIKTQAAEKYLLGELQPLEREAFEQHFFECPECAEDVRLGFQFSENARKVFRQDPRRVQDVEEAPKRRDWFARMMASLSPAALAPLAAGLAMVVFSGYQNLVQIPALRARVGQFQTAQVVSSTVLSPSSRAAVPVITVPANAPFFQLSLAPGGATPAGAYRCELRGENGKSVATVDVPKLDPDSNLTILVPAAGFAAGYYDAVLIGAGKELDHYRFEVRRP